MRHTIIGNKLHTKKRHSLSPRVPLYFDSCLPSNSSILTSTTVFGAISISILMSVCMFESLHFCLIAFPLSQQRLACTPTPCPFNSSMITLVVERSDKQPQDLLKRHLYNLSHECTCWPVPTVATPRTCRRVLSDFFLLFNFREEEFRNNHE